MTVQTTIIESHPSDVPGAGALGRHVEHDDRSRAYNLEHELIARGFIPSYRKPLRGQTWQRRVPVYNQGDLGSCTGNALAGMLSTEDADDLGSGKLEHLGEPDAVKIYRQATKLDSIDGSYPPDDTGSTGLAASKAAVKLGLAKSYKWGFDLQTVLATLSWVGPVGIGVSWYEGFDQIDDRGWVSISGSIRGGHEFLLMGLSADFKRVLAVNSWGPGWGGWDGKFGGYFRFSVDDLGRLLSEDGDAVVAFD